MIGIYFSGTGNSKYCIEKFLEAYDFSAQAYSIEDDALPQQIDLHEELVFSYPVQYSSLPKILSDYIVCHKEKWDGKKVFIIATMAMFSGDGAGVLGKLLEKYGATVIGGLHLQMPDSICDEKILKKSPEKNILMIQKTEKKIQNAAILLQQGKPKREGLGWCSWFLGYFSQRLWFGNKVKQYSSQLKIDGNSCTGCGKCVKLCPMQNVTLKEGKAISKNQCTLCYRCVNSCPKQAITLLGKKVMEQRMM